MQPPPGDAHSEIADLSFGEAMAAAQQAIAHAAKPESVDGGAPAPAAADRGNEAARTDAPAAPANSAAVVAGEPEDFEIELGSDDLPAPPVEPERAPPPSLPRAPRWVVALSAAAATVVVLVIVLLLSRSVILDAVPGSAGVYRMFGMTVDAVGVGLDIADVTSSREWSDEQEALIVVGHITNTTPGPLPVPPLKVALYGAADEALQSVTVPAAGKVLLAGESTVFRARIVAPQEAAQRIKITFDPAAGS
ncbi:MAG: hypothetical protein MUE49_06675 [Rhodospirillales bacterium]|nr:hypothetical protein [Rhodospirillales bacterium]